MEETVRRFVSLYIYILTEKDKTKITLFYCIMIPKLGMVQYKSGVITAARCDDSIYIYSSIYLTKKAKLKKKK